MLNPTEGAEGAKAENEEKSAENRLGCLLSTSYYYLKPLGLRLPFGKMNRITMTPWGDCNTHFYSRRKQKSLVPRRV